MPDFNKGVPRSGTPFSFTPNPNYTHRPPKTALDIINPRPYGPVYQPPQKQAPKQNPPRRTQPASTKAKPSLIDRVVKAQDTTRAAEKRYGKDSSEAKEQRKSLAVLMIQAGLMEPPKRNASSPTYDPFAGYKALPNKASKIKKSPPRTIPTDIQSMQEIFDPEMTRDILRGQGRLWQLEGRDPTPAEYSIMSTIRLRQIGREWDELPEREKALRDPMHPKHDEYVVASIARELEQKHRATFATSPERAWKMVERGTYKIFGGVALSALSNPSLEAGMTQQQKEEFRVAFGKAAFLATTMSLNAPMSVDDIVLAAVGKSVEGLLPRVRQALLTYLKKKRMTLRDPLDSISGTWTQDELSIGSEFNSPSSAPSRSRRGARKDFQKEYGRVNIEPIVTGKGRDANRRALSLEKVRGTIKNPIAQESADAYLKSIKKEVLEDFELVLRSYQEDVNLPRGWVANFRHDLGEATIFRANDALYSDPAEFPKLLAHEVAHYFQRFIDKRDFELLFEQYQIERRTAVTRNQKFAERTFEEWWADKAMRYENLHTVTPAKIRHASRVRKLLLSVQALFRAELSRAYEYYRRLGADDHATEIYLAIKGGGRPNLGLNAPGVVNRKSAKTIIRSSIHE